MGEVFIFIIFEGIFTAKGEKKVNLKNIGEGGKRVRNLCR